MSVIKYTVKKTGSGFTTIPNNVIQNLSDATALGIYVYMQSLPEAWEFHKNQLRAHFGIGIHKINSLLKLLESYNLIKIVQIRGTKGRFDRADIEVNDGSDFISSPCYKNRNTVTELRLSAPIKETPINKTSNKKNRDKAPPVDNPDEAPPKAARSSVSLNKNFKSLKAIPADFEPNDEAQALLWKTSERVKMPSTDLLQKFIEVSTKYKTKSADWQATFMEFLERERPKRTYEDSNGKLKRYDGGKLHY